MKLIVGLGNPGEKYENTRHNIGFSVLDKFISNYSNKFSNLTSFRLIHKLNSLITQFGGGAIGMQDIFILAKPQTFMNLSGEAVAKIMQFYKIKPKDVWVISDDLNLELGQLRIRFGGSDGGHNGLKSVIGAVGENFWRIRIGIGSNLKVESEKLKVKSSIPAERYVLEKFTKNEKEIIDKAIDETANIMLKSVSSGLTEKTIRIVESRK